VRTLGAGESGELFGIRDAAFVGGSVVVLTAPEPAVHLYHGTEHRAWGKKGRGPAELTDPVDVTPTPSGILVRDFTLSKIVLYDTHGALVSSRDMGGAMTGGVHLTARDTFLTLLKPGGESRAVVRMRAGGYDSVFSYQASSRTVLLEAPGSPSLTLPAPYAPEPLWTALANGRLAFWDGARAELALLDGSGAPQGRFPLPANSLPVSQADRDHWLATAIPSGNLFGKSDPFAAVRKAAPDRVQFPTSLPAVLALLPDPAGGVWVLRTPEGSGQLWAYVDSAGPRRSVRLKPGRKLLAVGDSLLAVRARGDMDEEIVEIYRKPRP
jgi:hypothetical protein